MKQMIFTIVLLSNILITSCTDNQSALSISTKNVDNKEIAELTQQKEYIYKPTEFTIEDLTYEVIDTNKVAIIRCNTSVTDIDIPTIVMHDSIEYKIVSIECDAFCECVKLKSITIPDGLTCINDNTFYNCISLSSVTIPNSVARIGEGAFRYCTSLVSIYIPNSIQTIDNYAFANCTKLESINIPNGVKLIGSGLFNECESLTSIIIPSKLSLIKSATFRKCKNLTSIVIPNNIEEIRKISFSECINLLTVTIGKGVRNIRTTAFYGCDNLANVICLSQDPPILEEEVFPYPNKATLQVPRGSLERYKASDWNNYFSRIEEIDG